MSGNVKNFIQPWGETGKTIYGIFRRTADGYLLSQADGNFANAPATPYVPAAEDGTIKGRYAIAESRQAWNDGGYEFYFYKQAGGAAAPASDTLVGSGTVVLAGDNFTVAAAPGDAMTLTAAYDAAKVAASQTSVNAIPTTPLLTSDARLSHLDADISSRSTLAAGAAMALTTDERGAVAVQVEAHIINDTDSEQVLKAITDKIAAANPSLAGLTLAAIASAVWAGADKTGYTLDAAQRVTLAALQPDYTPAKAADVAVTVNPTLTQAEHDQLLAIPTVAPAQPTDITDARDAILAVVAVDSNLQTLLQRVPGTVPQLQEVIDGVLDAAIADHETPGSVGGWLGQEAAPIVLPLVSAQTASLVLVNQTVIEMKQRNSYLLPFNLERDCTGWAVYFGAKEKYAQAEYAIPVREAVFTDQANGVGYVALSVDDTDLSGVFHGELQLRQGSQRNSPESYTLNVKPTVFSS